MKSTSNQTDAERSLAQAERRAFRQAVRMGGLNYVRSRDLHRIIALRRGWIDNQDAAPAARKIRKALLRALRAMVRSKRQETWHYSRSRHLAVLQALAGEIQLTRE